MTTLAGVSLKWFAKPSEIEIFIVIFFVILGVFFYKHGLGLLVFLLPLLPTLNQQISFFFPNILTVKNITGIDLVAGFVIGVMLRALIKIKEQVLPRSLSISIAVLFMTGSTVLAISRNLFQSLSEFKISGLIYNIKNWESLGWFDDYYPIVDYMSYGVAFTFMLSSMWILSQSNSAYERVLRPILWSVIVAGLWSILQAQTGHGLSVVSESGYRYNSILGFSANGFQPDIHAFAGHMLLGVIGALGGFFVKDLRIRKELIISGVIIGWIGLIVSRSRGSIILAIIATLVFLGVLLKQKGIKIFTKKSVALTSIFLIFMLAILYINFQFNEYLAQKAEWFSTLSFSEINVSTGYRIEIFTSAIKMWHQFPMLGLGQGAFYRSSSIYDFSGSEYFKSVGGENAHNYLLQVLVENGAVGFLILASILFLPCLTKKLTNRMVAVIVLIISFLLGNVFAHSLLVRVNLFLLFSCIGLLYVEHEKNKFLERTCVQKLRSMDQNLNFQLLVSLAIALTVVYSTLEVCRSFNKTPFVNGYFCHKNLPLKIGDWTSGKFYLDVPSEAVEIEMKVRSFKFGDTSSPQVLSAIYSVLNAHGIQNVHRYEFVIEDNNVIRFPIYRGDPLNRIAIFFEVSKCLIPKNLGINLDPRRLGIIIDEITWK